MKALTFYFDVISPFAYLQLPRMLALRERIAIEAVPIVFGAVLARNGQLGPAEIPGKREFTYRFVQWQADRSGIPLRFPPAHPLVRSPRCACASPRAATGPPRSSGTRSSARPTPTPSPTWRWRTSWR